MSKWMLNIPYIAGEDKKAGMLRIHNMMRQSQVAQGFGSDVPVKPARPASRIWNDMSTQATEQRVAMEVVRPGTRMSFAKARSRSLTSEFDSLLDEFSGNDGKLGELARKILPDLTQSDLERMADGSSARKRAFEGAIDGLVGMDSKIRNRHLSSSDKYLKSYIIGHAPARGAQLSEARASELQSIVKASLGDLGMMDSDSNELMRHRIQSRPLLMTESLEKEFRHMIHAYHEVREMNASYLQAMMGGMEGSKDPESLLSALLPSPDDIMRGTIAHLIIDLKSIPVASQPSNLAKKVRQIWYNVLNLESTPAVLKGGDKEKSVARLLSLYDSRKQLVKSVERSINQAQLKGADFVTAYQIEKPAAIDAAAIRALVKPAAAINIQESDTVAGILGDLREAVDEDGVVFQKEMFKLLETEGLAFSIGRNQNMNSPSSFVILPIELPTFSQRPVGWDRRWMVATMRVIDEYWGFIYSDEGILLSNLLYLVAARTEELFNYKMDNTEVTQLAILLSKDSSSYLPPEADIDYRTGLPVARRGSIGRRGGILPVVVTEGSGEIKYRPLKSLQKLITNQDSANISSLTGRLKAKDSEIKDLKDELNISAEKLQEAADAGAAAAVKATEELDAAKEKARKTRERTRNVVSTKATALQLVIDESKADVARIEVEKTTLDSEIAALKVEITSGEAGLKKESELLQELSDKLKERDEGNNVLERERDELLIQIESLKAELAAQEVSPAEARNDYGNLSDEAVQQHFEDLLGEDMVDMDTSELQLLLKDEGMPQDAKKAIKSYLDWLGGRKTNSEVIAGGITARRRARMKLSAGDGGSLSLGLVHAEVIIGVNIIRDIGAGLRDVFGGRSKIVEKQIKNAMTKVKAELTSRAKEMGATSIRNIRVEPFTYGASGSMMGLVGVGDAYGPKKNPSQSGETRFRNFIMQIPPGEEFSTSGLVDRLKGRYRNVPTVRQLAPLLSKLSDEGLLRRKSGFNGEKTWVTRPSYKGNPPKIPPYHPKHYSMRSQVYGHPDATNSKKSEYQIELKIRSLVNRFGYEAKEWHTLHFPTRQDEAVRFAKEQTAQVMEELRAGRISKHGEQFPLPAQVSYTVYDERLTGSINDVTVAHSDDRFSKVGETLGTHWLDELSESDQKRARKYGWDGEGLVFPGPNTPKEVTMKWDRIKLKEKKRERKNNPSDADECCMICGSCDGCEHIPNPPDVFGVNREGVHIYFGIQGIYSMTDEQLEDYPPEDLPPSEVHLGHFPTGSKISVVLPPEGPPKALASRFPKSHVLLAATGEQGQLPLTSHLPLKSPEMQSAQQRLFNKSLGYHVNPVIRPTPRGMECRKCGYAVSLDEYKQRNTTLWDPNIERMVPNANVAIIDWSLTPDSSTSHTCPICKTSNAFHEVHDKSNPPANSRKYKGHIILKQKGGWLVEAYDLSFKTVKEARDYITKHVSGTASANQRCVRVVKGTRCKGFVILVNSRKYRCDGCKAEYKES